MSQQFEVVIVRCIILESVLTVAVENAVKLVLVVQMDRMEILDGLSPSLQVAISGSRMLREHGMRVDARGKHRVVIDTKLGVFSKVRVLVTGPPVVKDPPAGGTRKGLDVVLDVEIDAIIEHLGDQSVVIAGNMVEGIQCPVGADKVGMSEGFFRGLSFARIKCEELPDKVEQ
jgi:hypothetical protein